MKELNYVYILSYKKSKYYNIEMQITSAAIKFKTLFSKYYRT